MSACLVCGRETECAGCGGTGQRRFVEDYEYGTFVLEACSCRRGLTHTHPRKERRRARRVLIDALWPRLGLIEGVPGFERAYRRGRGGASVSETLQFDGLRSGLAPEKHEGESYTNHVARLAHLRDRTMRDALDAHDGVS